MREKARRDGAPSLSASIAEILSDSVERQTLDEILDEIFQVNPLTEEERAWADRVLGLSS